MDVVAECIHSLMPVAMGTCECVAVNVDDVFLQLNDEGHAYISITAYNW